MSKSTDTDWKQYLLALYKLSNTKLMFKSAEVPHMCV